METHGIAPLGLFLIAAVVFYLFAKPGSFAKSLLRKKLVLGVLPGFIDYYFMSALQRRNAKIYNKANYENLPSVLNWILGGLGFG